MLSIPSRSGVPGRDHVERPQQSGIETGLKLVQLIPDVRSHLRAMIANGPESCRPPNSVWRGRIGASQAADRGEPRTRRALRRPATAARAASRAEAPRQRGAAVEPVDALRRLGSEHRAEAELAASATRRSGWATKRSSPVSPTSPKQASGRSRQAPSGSPRCAEARASATARSAPGSSTRTPPATLTNTSAAASDGAAVAGEHGDDHRQPVAVDAGGDPARRHDLGRRHQRLHLDQQRPGALHRAEHARARRPARLADEARRGVGDLDQPAGAHLEHARPRWSPRSGS